VSVAILASPELKPAFREYAKAVYGSTDAYASGLSHPAFDRKVDTRFVGEQTAAFILTDIAAWHVMEHGDEIAAGLPFRLSMVDLGAAEHADGEAFGSDATRLADLAGREAI